MCYYSHVRGVLSGISDNVFFSNFFFYKSMSTNATKSTIRAGRTLSSLSNFVSRRVSSSTEFCIGNGRSSNSVSVLDDSNCGSAGSCNIFMVGSNSRNSSSMRVATRDLVSCLGRGLTRRCSGPVFILTRSPLRFSSQANRRNANSATGCVFSILSGTKTGNLGVVFVFNRGRDNN